MAQARTKARKTAKPGAPTNGVALPSADVLTLPEAAAYLRVSESELLQLITDQALPGRQFGGQWRFLKSAIQDWLRTPPERGSREAVLSTIGAWKGDPEMVAETMAIYDKRRRLGRGHVMILLDTDILTLVFALHARATERMRVAPEAPVVSAVARIEVLQGRFDSILKAADALLRAQDRLAKAEKDLEKYRIIRDFSLNATRSRGKFAGLWIMIRLVGA